MRRWWSDFLHGNGPVGRCVPTGIAGRRRPGRGKGIAITIACAVVIGAASWLYLDSNGHLDNTAAFVKAPAQDALSVSFVFCADSYRTNCVVNGDTFWFWTRKFEWPISIRLNSARPAARLNG
ncbi:hypothetical protein FHS26_004748 [Rhizobium pisi]|uniref:Uncharacterized protein n=1 Tax=Rhizobium pisi TaxID=574561 RepID=A0A7W5BPX1_9HYPH|nr:hypothetical protein [Rhizobium pisi]